MSNPFLGATSMHTPTQTTDHYGDSSGGWYDATPWHLAAVCIVALMIVTAMQMAGFRAMVGIGRG